MIRSLHIENVALIDRLDIELGPGLTILTGQTGAGKSIIIGALNMVLGERADTSLIRQGADKAIAEAVFDDGEDPRIASILAGAEIETGGDLILRRELKPSGSRAFINDTPVPVQVLKQVGDLLVDLHGQHEHQLILRDDQHRVVLDGTADLAPLSRSWTAAWQRVQTMRHDLAELRRKERSLAEKADLYRFQLKELDDASLSDSEMEELREEMRRLEHAEDLQLKAGQVAAIAEHEDGGLMEMLSRVKGLMEDLADIEPRFRSYLEEVAAAQITLRDMVAFTERYRDAIEHDPERLEQLRRRQADLLRLQKKYGRTLGELVAYRDGIREELKAIDQADSRTASLEQEIAAETTRLAELAQRLHSERRRVGAALSEGIVNALGSLGIAHAAFAVEVAWMEDPDGWLEVDGRTVRAQSHGCDEVRFLISTNRGESPKPLARIASGGEVSRVMLALKSILAAQQSLPVMIFDEIDTGISGAVSDMVGRMMRRLSERCQILAITHQPQIASQAHHHFRVEKTEEQERTLTRIVALDRDARIREVASLMSGMQVTESAIRSATELIERNGG